MNIKSSGLDEVFGWLGFYIISMIAVLPAAGIFLTFFQFSKVLSLIGANNSFVFTGTISCAFMLYLVNESIQAGRSLKKKKKFAFKKNELFFGKFFYIGLGCIFIHLFSGIEPVIFFLKYFFYIIFVFLVYFAGSNYISNSVRVKKYCGIS